MIQSAVIRAETAPEARGESAEHTIIRNGDYAAMNDMGTFRTYTMKVTGNDITLENLTVENTAGFSAGQAVALHVEGDRFRAVNCRIIGNQDTLLAGGELVTRVNEGRGRHLYA